MDGSCIIKYVSEIDNLLKITPPSSTLPGQIDIPTALIGIGYYLFEFVYRTDLPNSYQPNKLAEIEFILTINKICEYPIQITSRLAISEIYEVHENNVASLDRIYSSYRVLDHFFKF